MRKALVKLCDIEKGKQVEEASLDRGQKHKNDKMNEM